MRLCWNRCNRCIMGCCTCVTAFLGNKPREPVLSTVDAAWCRGSSGSHSLFGPMFRHTPKKPVVLHVLTGNQSKKHLDPFSAGRQCIMRFANGTFRVCFKPFGNRLAMKEMKAGRRRRFSLLKGLHGNRTHLLGGQGLLQQRLRYKRGDSNGDC